MKHAVTIPPHAAWPATDADLDVFARTLYGECRGEQRLGKVAVAWVIRNRAALDLRADKKPDWWGEGIQGVCKAPMQFSCWNAGDLNLPKLQAVSAMDPVFAECINIARGVLLATLGDPTNGSTHYHTIKSPPRAKAWPPDWAVGHRGAAVIGRHVFYNTVA